MKFWMVDKKPRLRQYNGRWYCNRVMGDTPDHAYEAWKVSVRSACFFF